MSKINIFYQEPDPDRWFKYDRFPRKLIRLMIRGRHKPGGIMMVTIQLLQGLKNIKHPFRFNDFKYAKQHPNELVCINGKPQLLFDRKWENPVLFGPGIFSHPLACPDLFTIYPNVKKLLVPCTWMKDMFTPFYGESRVVVWPVGIDTQKWSEKIKAANPVTDFLIYNKVRWEKSRYLNTLITPIIEVIKTSGLTYKIITYGSYSHDTLIKQLGNCKFVIFLCEHETQGLAYQQILATGTPILAWDRGGFWQDPQYYPDRVKFGPVSSVPYWDDRCGLKFKDVDEFRIVLPEFLSQSKANKFSPRAYILENLTLELAAGKFIEIVNGINTQL